MQSLKDRPGRLQMFARLAAEAGVTTHAAAQSAQSPEKCQEGPKTAAPISALERQELAEIARLPIPKPIRQSLGHQRGTSQPQLDSQRRHHSASPARQLNGNGNGTGTGTGTGNGNGNGNRNGKGFVGDGRDAHRSDMFNGSQLGDSFMNSGITTPHDEAEDQEPERKSMIPPREPPRGNFDRTLRPPNNASFQIGDDLLMKVVTGPRRHDPSHMNDGFHHGAINGQSNENNRPYAMDYGRPGSPAERRPKLPLREVKIRNSQQPLKRDDSTGRDIRSGSPAFDTNNWQRRFMAGASRHTRFLEPDDDSTSTVLGAMQESPRAKRANGSPVRDHQAKPLTLTELLPQPTIDKKRRRPTLDYDDMALNNMNFMDLHNEPFDFDPSTATPHAGHGAGAGNLFTKLDQYRQQPEKEQRFLFRSLSIDDWEVAGDWFADQFADIMQRLKEARQDKRRMIKDFEDEAAAREEAVRLRSEAIDRKLSRMRQDGQRVVAAHELQRQDGH